MGVGAAWVAAFVGLAARLAAEAVALGGRATAVAVGAKAAHMV